MLRFIIFGCFSLLRLHGSDFATTVLNATFKLFNQSSTSTCFLVKRDDPADKALYVVTAEHSFANAKGGQSIVVLRFPQPDGSVARLDFPVNIRKDGKDLWVSDPKYDVAVLRVEAEFPVTVHPLPESVIGDAKQLAESGAHVCSPLFVLTYPQRFEAHQAGYPVARQGVFSTPPLLNAAAYPTFLADFTTFAGDSGGPVFMPGKDGRPLLVGLVLSQFHHTEKVKTEYSETNINHPLGLGTVLHARYIKSTLDTAARTQ